MGGRVLLAAALSVVLAATSVSPAPAQLSGDGPPPPEYRVKEDGTLVVDGDVEVLCSEFGLGLGRLGEDHPGVRACEAAGFGAAAGSYPGASAPAAPAPALPETGGPAAALVPLALLAGGLLAFGLVRRDF